MRVRFRKTIFLLGLFVMVPSRVTGETCRLRCGSASPSGGCSCRAACVSLQSCCEDYGRFCLQVLPSSSSMLGGRALAILNVAFRPGQSLLCRFNGEIDVPGVVDAEGRGHCVSPLLHQTGWVPFQVSTDGTHFDRAGEYLSVLPGKLEPSLRVSLVNSTRWQYYGTPGTAGALWMAWNVSALGADSVNVELWGYREAGGAAATEGVGWTYLYSLGRGLPNRGTFNFVPRAAEPAHYRWELGSIRVSAGAASEGARDVQALWSDTHALAWHMEQAFRDNSAAWAENRCLEWDAREKSLPNFLGEIMDCPCTLAQARADAGRFYTDHGCDIEKGSVCTYHPGSVHCVRAIQASPQYGSGQQCCYDSSGAQVLTGDSTGGSTPDRAHAWGSPPYREPPRVPGLSHWIHDVMSFYYCCLWSPLCHVYLRLRPSSGCKSYRPPRAGAVLGGPHFVTFDGLRYTFNGRGEYDLVQAPRRGLSVQARTEQVALNNGSLASATRLSSVAVKENSSDAVEVRLARRGDRLQVLRNQKVLSFGEQRWVDLRGAFVFSPTPQKVTVMLSSGVGLEARAREDGMAMTVLLPTDFANHTRGLLGQMNSDPSDDLLTGRGEVVPSVAATPEDIFGFGTSWRISKETSLFTYDSQYLLDTYHRRPAHDPVFHPAFGPPEGRDDPLVAAILSMCYGDGAAFCKYETLTSRSLATGNATMRAYRSHRALVQDLQPVVSCGWLPAPSHGKKNGTRYTQGQTLWFSCDGGFLLYGSTRRSCQENGTWTGEQTYCLRGSQWTPGSAGLRCDHRVALFPSRCSSDDNLGYVLGAVGSLATLITMAVMIKLNNRKREREKLEQIEIHDVMG